MIDFVGRQFEDFPEPNPVTAHGSARVVAFCNQKGGVGKTTTCINLAAALAELGRKILIVDFDPQGAASAGLGLNPYEVDNTIYTLITNPKLNSRDFILPTKIKNLDIIPANIDLSAAEMQLVNEVAREQILKIVLDPLRKDYDAIFIDCQPSLGLLAINALVAADGILIPLSAEYFAMRGLALLVDTVEKVKGRLNTNLRIDGIVTTMFDARTLHSNEVITSLYGGFHNDLLHTVITRSVKLPDSTIQALPITHFAPNHKVAKAYFQLAKEVISRGVVK
ncbi:MAG: AAA family ATPase [Bifidobacteriaceae bacterium]|jgi:chromosome partitioning protein|nr:AAA family ATPase [Bifidobacteriaceae bacterium]